MVITGGTGLIGREVARQLVDRGEEVVLFDIVPREKMWVDIKENVTFVQGDLANWMSVLNVVKEYQPSSIFHLGARRGISCNKKQRAPRHDGSIRVGAHKTGMMQKKGSLKPTPWKRVIPRDGGSMA